MATHDYVIANGTGAAVRSDLNGALAAIVSQNSSATEPSPSYAYQRWADTTAGVMKMRNGANNAWISLYELDGTFLAGDISLSAGAAATPSLFFTGDTNTGIYSPGADQVAISTGGTVKATVDSSGRLLVGTSSSRTNINFGGTAIQPKIQLEGAVGDFTTGFSLLNYSNGGYYPTVTLGLSLSATQGTNTLVNNNSGLGVLQFVGNDGASFQTAASISAVVDGTPGAGDMPGRLVFSTTADGAASPTERMRIDSSGFVVAGGTSNNNSRIAANISGVLNGFASRTTAAAGTGYSHFSASVNISGALADVFYVYGNGNVQNTNNSYGALSDAKLKENIVDATSQWADVKAFRVRKYNFKEGQTHTQIGLVSQEVELVSPGLVTQSPDRDAEGNDLGTVTKSVNYSVLYMKAVKALQEAMERIETLEASNADMLARVTALEAA